MKEPRSQVPGFYEIKKPLAMKKRKRGGKVADGLSGSPAVFTSWLCHARRNEAR